MKTFQAYRFFPLPRLLDPREPPLRLGVERDLLPPEERLGVARGLLPPEERLGVARGLLPPELRGVALGLLPPDPRLGVARGLLPRELRLRLGDAFGRAVDPLRDLGVALGCVERWPEESRADSPPRDLEPRGSEARS